MWNDKKLCVGNCFLYFRATHAYFCEHVRNSQHGLQFITMKYDDRDVYDLIEKKVIGSEYVLS